VKHRQTGREGGGGEGEVVVMTITGMGMERGIKN